MRYLQKHGDGFRRWLLNEPYGDPFMSVDLIVPPDHPQAQAGYIIMEAMGYPLYSGSNTICTAAAILENGVVPMEDGEQTLVLESPAGLAWVTAHNANGRVQSVTTRSEPAFVCEQNMKVEVPGWGEVRFDLVWSGAYFALVDAESLGFGLMPGEVRRMEEFGLALVEAARPVVTDQHPELGDVGPLPFAHFMGPLEPVEGGYRSRSATYVHPGVICRSPTGTGTTARMAVMYENGQLQVGKPWRPFRQKAVRSWDGCWGRPRSVITGRSVLISPVAPGPWPGRKSCWTWTTPWWMCRTWKGC